MTKFAAGSMTAEDFNREFGLSKVAEGDAYSEGSSTGTKQVAGLGTYLTEDDFNRNRNSDKTWDAYASVYGEDAAKSKREGNEDGLSINALDALYDKLAKGGGTSAPAKAKEKVQSYTLSKARAMTDAYETDFRPNLGNMMFDPEYKGGQKFLDKYKLNLENEMQGKTIYKDGKIFDPSPNEKVEEEEKAVMGMQ